MVTCMTDPTHEGDVARPGESCFRPGELPVVSPLEEWYRACDRHSWDDELERASNLMFQCGSDDEGELSGARSTKTTGPELLRHLRDDKRRDVREIRSIRVGQLTEALLHLHDDSAVIDPPPENPKGHAYLDLKHLPSGKGNPAKRERERVRALLLDASRHVQMPIASEPDPDQFDEAAS